MFQDSDRQYNRRRADMEHACAEAATSEQVRQLHRELAALYEERVAAASELIG